MSIVDPATVRYCLAQGMTQTELAREYGVTRQYIHKLAKQAGHEPLRTIVTENFPWPIQPDFTKNNLYQALRVVGLWNMDPNTVKPNTLQKLRGGFSANCKILTPFSTTTQAIHPCRD